MKKHFIFLLLFITTIVSGCAAVPQTPIGLNQEAIKPASGRIGIAMTALPEIDTVFPGADCLLCYATASLANKSLTNHTKTFKHETLLELKSNLAALLKQKGADVFMIDDDLNIEDLDKFSGKAENVALKNFQPLKEKYNIDQLLVVTINGVGFVRNYASYVPTSDPKGYVRGMGYIVNLNNNTYEWYLPVDVTKSADGVWDEPPSFPGLTNAYYQAVEIANDQFIGPFLEAAK